MDPEQKMKIVTVATSIVSLALAAVVIANSGYGEQRCSWNTSKGEWYRCTDFRPIVDGVLGCQLNRDLTNLGELQCRQN